MMPPFAVSVCTGTSGMNISPKPIWFDVSRTCVDTRSGSFILDHTSYYLEKKIRNMQKVSKNAKHDALISYKPVTNIQAGGPMVVLTVLACAKLYNLLYLLDSLNFIVRLHIIIIERIDQTFLGQSFI
jgi:hypothetical protein